MRLLASVKVRLFLVCWIVYSLFFATNVVREHYPAFALIERGDWVCDRYEGMHWDLFRHTDGHVYTGNNVMGSLIAVPPLLLFDPALDRLEAHSRAKLAANPQVDTTYDTGGKYPLREKMFRQVKLAGLDLRFGASTAITSVFLMAPLCAWMVVLMLGVLLERGVERGRAVWLAFLFAFATPVFYRSAHLNHNVFLMAALFGAFLLLWRRGTEPSSTARRAWAGFLCGMAISLDYAGVVPAGVLALYFAVTRAREASVAVALRECVAPVLAAVPPILFLLGTQWAMYGDPFTPGQFVMPDQNEFVGEGKRGMGWPSPEILLKNLISPSFGLIPFAPLLALAFWPARRAGELVFPRRERRWSAALVVAFMLFCAMNTYSLLQFNTGFRYLLPLVPFLFLAASDHLARTGKRTLAAITVVCVAHAVVLSMTREVSDTENDLRREAIRLGVAQWEVPGYWRAMLTQTPVPASWSRVLDDGPQLPWLTVLGQTQPNHPWLASPWLPLGLMALCGAVIAAAWRVGARSVVAAPREPHT